MSAHYERGILLFQQQRHGEALEQFQLHLAEAPEDSDAFAMQGLALIALKKYSEAEEAIVQAIQHGADNPMGYYCMSELRVVQEKYKLAHASIDEALLLQPDDAHFLVHKAQIFLCEANWKEALSFARAAQNVDSESVDAANIASVALVQMGKREEAGQSLDATLNKDPDNAITHANKGWALLHASDYEQAQIHFREALRLDPDSEWARKGMVQSLQSRHLLYRWMLKYYLWMSAFNQKAQWAIVIGAFVGYRVVIEIGQKFPSASVITIPLVIAYLTFVYLSWTCYSMFNLSLRFHPFGRYVLSKEERIGSSFVAACMGAALICGVIAVLVPSVWFGMALIAVCFLLYVIPISTCVQCRKPNKRKIAMGITAGLGFMGLAGLVGMLTGNAGLFTLGKYYFYGVLLFTWLGGALAQ